MNPLEARARGKELADFLAFPRPVEECSDCPFNIYRPAHESSNGMLTCTLTGSHERRHSQQFARKQDCPVPSEDKDESWREGTEWHPIGKGVTLCPTCANAIGLIGRTFMNPCPYCGQSNLRNAPL